MRRGFIGLAATLAMVFGMGYAATPPREPKRPARLTLKGFRPTPSEDRRPAALEKRKRKLARNARLLGNRS